MKIKQKKINRNAEDRREADLFLKKHVGLIHCENKLTLIQRKICNILLFNALDTINDNFIVTTFNIIQSKELC